ncbi:endonuclease domain-containing protein [Rathayibacter sp. CAU 1779]
MRPGPLPPHLGSSFSVVDAIASGATARRMRASDLEIPFRGVRRRLVINGLADAGPARSVAGRSDAGLSDTGRSDAASRPAIGAARAAEARILANARAYAHCMTEHEFFSHVTAAVIWGIPLAYAAIRDSRVHVSVMAPHRASKRLDVVGHQARAGLVTVCTHPVTGLRVSSPASTWASLATVLTHPYDLVAAADAVVHVPRMPGGFAFSAGERTEPLATIDDLGSCVTAGRRVGIRALRVALPRVRTGAASRPETWTRLTILDAGLPEPVLDHDVFDEHGTFVACVDLAYPELRIAIEYDGGQHRTDAQQWARDIDRLEALAALGWHVIRVDRRLLFERPRELARRVAAARARRGA